MSEQSKHVLITGLSATGKTTLSKFFREKGKNAYDVDKVLARWIDKKTGKPKAPTDEEWKRLSGIEWEWDRRKLKRLLKQNKEAYLFGSANNTYGLANLFDKVYYLHASKKLILQRLKSEKRDNDFGRHGTQRKLIMSWVKPVAERAKEAGFEFIDASLSPQRIFNIICKKQIKGNPA